MIYRQIYMGGPCDGKEVDGLKFINYVVEECKHQYRGKEISINDLEWGGDGIRVIRLYYQGLIEEGKNR